MKNAPASKPGRKERNEYVGHNKVGHSEDVSVGAYVFPRGAGGFEHPRVGKGHFGVGGF